MRRLFADLLYEEMKKNEKIFVLTGDVGYKLWDQIRDEFQDRFINPGSAEQLMLGMAVGMALEGKIPIVYSITPFLLYRPFEIIRNYLNHESVPVKLVGGGRNKDYGVAGYTHWAEEDTAIMAVMSNVRLFYPQTETELKIEINDFLYNKKPCYLNLRKS